MRCPRIRPLLLFSALATLAACGTGSDGHRPPPPPPEEVFEESERVIDETMDTITRAIEEGADPFEAFSLAAGRLRREGVVEAVDCHVRDDGSINFVVTFTNGFDFVVPVRIVDRIAEPTTTGRWRGSVSVALPGSKRALFIDEPSFKSDVHDLAAIAGRHGYDVNVMNPPLVESYVGIDQYDLVYVGTHGTYYEKDGVGHFALETGTPRSEALDADGLRHLVPEPESSIVLMRAMEVAISVPMDISVSSGATYGVNELFIHANNGEFGSDSLFYVDTCDSAMPQDSELLPPLAQVLRYKNVTHYLGWDDYVSNQGAVQAANYIVTRAFGEVPAGLQHTPPPVPPIRPWALSDTLWSAYELGYTVDPSRGANLVYLDASDGERELIFVPVIHDLWVYTDVGELRHELNVHGIFGDLEGQVYLCETPPAANDVGDCLPLEIMEWEEDRIQTLLDAECRPSCHGHVVVEIDGRTGNVHPLTAWEGVIDVCGVLPGTGPDVSVQVHAMFVGEIVDERPEPEAEPNPMYGSCIAPFGLQSHVEYELTGTAMDDHYVYTYDTQGIATPATAEGSTHFFGVVGLAPERDTATFDVTLWIDAQVLVTSRETHEGGIVPTQIGVPMTFDAVLRADGTIEGGILTKDGLTIEWGPMVPTNPPTAETAR